MHDPTPLIPDMPNGWDGYRAALLLAEAALCHAGHSSLHECGDAPQTLEVDRILDLVRRELCDEADLGGLDMDPRWEESKSRCERLWKIGPLEYK